MLLHDKKKYQEISNFKGCSSSSKIIGLLFRGHQFELHKFQDHLRLT